MRRLTAQSSLFVPPRRFRAASDVRVAEFCDRAILPPARGATQAQKRGKAYERRALFALMEEFLELRMTPWIRYQNSDGIFYCQPDAIVEDEERVFVFEVKARHCIEAWFQLRHLYSPVIRKLTGKDPLLVEVTKSFDPAVPWPEDIWLCTQARELQKINGESAMGVLWIQ
jgi:hypothetical protein